jgi:hypothetical protein
VGKSTVFNRLTGLHQHTGNWTGKTVLSARGRFRTQTRRCVLVDVPGAYSLSARSEEERVARNYLLSDEPEAILRKKGFRKACDGWIRNGLGLYGSFITHLSLLLMLVACACVFALEVKTDYTIRVGESVTLEDGTVLRVDGFSLESDGRLDYVSDLSATLPDGAELTGTIRVNQPMRAGRYKIYQSSYEYAGQVDVRTSPTLVENAVRSVGSS